MNIFAGNNTVSSQCVDYARLVRCVFCQSTFRDSGDHQPAVWTFCHRDWM